ncbi:MAG: Zn-dependent exopeptidase M28 [Saprospiraceae bacterium]|nr:Zn-dependent exopeptidase M28 [Saprospiraceae bacterium]
MDKSELDRMADAAMEFTAEVTNKWTARLAGSPACLACADYLKTTLTQFCDEVDHQVFSVRPGAFLGYIRINIILYLVALISLFLGQLLIAALIASLSVLITVMEFFIYKEFVDGLYPKKQGKNVFGHIEPVGELKQQIIISAHHDSAHIFNFLEKNPSTYVRKVLAATATQLGLFILTYLLLILTWAGLGGNALHWIITLILAVAAVNLYPLWFFYDKKGTPGAGDNLVCTALAIEVGKFFAREKAQGRGLKHTRLVIGSWDAEECGLRGARAFVKQYRAELHTIKTYNFNLECMYDHKALSFLRSDLNNFVPLSVDMANEGAAIGRELDYAVGVHPFPFLAGGTDAAEFAKAGIEATTLAAMDWQNREADIPYHTTRDTIDAVDREALSRSIAIGIRYVQEKEKEVIV